MHGSRTRDQYHRLISRIRVKYQTSTACLAVMGMHFDFERIADPDVVLDQVADEEDRLEKVSGRRSVEDQLHLPYWAELWDSSLGIGQHLAAHVQTLGLAQA